MVGMIFKDKNEPKKGVPYAVQGGIYVGEMLVYIEKTKTEYCFLSIPKNVVRNIPKDKFTFAINEKIVEEVDKLPDGVYSILKAQYFYNKRGKPK